MLSRFSDVLRTAADVLAPPASRIEDFEYHWKLIQNFYNNQDVHGKVHIEDTKVPLHLHQMLQLLIDEENENPHVMGPCLEQLVSRDVGLLDCLAALATADHPPGVRSMVLSWCTSLLRRLKQPFINHMTVYQPIQRLLVQCNNNMASPTEKEEVELLLTLCGLVRKHPGLANIFTTSFEDKEKTPNVQTQKIPTTLRIQTPTKNKLFEYEMLPDPIKKVALVSQSNSDVSSQHSNPKKDGEFNDGSSVADDTCSFKSQKAVFEDNDKFLLIDLLLSYLSSADNHIVLRACEGVMIVASLNDDGIANLITGGSSVCESIVDKLVDKYKAIPANIDPCDVDQLNITWGLVVHDLVDRQSTRFHGHRELTCFLSWLDYCDTLMKECHPSIAMHVARTFRHNFLEAIVEPGLNDLHHTILVTAIISKCLKVIDSPDLINEISNWLVGEGEVPEWPLMHTLIDNCISDNLELSLETLRFFESMLEKPTEHSLQRLVLRHVCSRGYHALPSQHNYDEQDERDRLNAVSLQQERDRNRQAMEELLHAGQIQSHVSDLLDSGIGSVPGSKGPDKCNIHRIINSDCESDALERHFLPPAMSDTKGHISITNLTVDKLDGKFAPTTGRNDIMKIFLLILPKALLSDPVGIDYEQYISDAHRHYQVWLDITASFHWPIEAACHDSNSSNHSCDSRPEADLHLDCKDLEVNDYPDKQTKKNKQLAKDHYFRSHYNNIEMNSSSANVDNIKIDELEANISEQKISSNISNEDICCVSADGTNICEGKPNCPFSQNLILRPKDRHLVLNAKKLADKSSIDTFDEGPFFKMLFGLLAKMTTQPYQINLQLTSIISKLAMLPHPYLHEYLLNPLLPTNENVITLFKVLQGLSKKMVAEIPRVKNYKMLIEHTRHQLMGDDVEFDLRSDHNQLLESLIVIEEFCKELAAIAFVKHQLSHNF